MDTIDDITFVCQMDAEIGKLYLDEKLALSRCIANKVSENIGNIRVLNFQVIYLRNNK
jgi:hypothetical protein